MNLATSRVGSDIRRIVKTWGTWGIWQSRSDPNFRQTDLLVAGETRASKSVAGFSLVVPMYEIRRLAISDFRGVFSES